jgi:hypothetical protein
LVSADLLLGAKLLVFGNKYKFPQNPAPVENIRSILAKFHFTFPHFYRCFPQGRNGAPEGQNLISTAPGRLDRCGQTPQRGPQISSLITFENGV